MKFYMLLPIFLFLNLNVFSQDNTVTIGIKFTGVAFHPKKKPMNGTIYKWKVDKLGRFVLNGGVTFTGNLRIWKFLGIGIGQTIMPYDCGGKWAGASQIGIAFLGNFNTNHSLNSVIGPTIFYRQNWNSIPNYIDDNFYRKSRNLKRQYKIIWYAGHLEYTYWYSKNIGVSLDVLPGFPELIELSTGINYRNKK